MITSSTLPRFMIIGLVPPRQTKDKTLAVFEEVQSLVATYGGQVWAAVAQNSSRRDNATYIGTGKALEIAQTIALENIDMVVINDIVKPSQLYELHKIFASTRPQILVWDRIDLILHLFSKHATTKEAKLQIRLAFMHHMGPRIYGMGMELSQQAGGIGTRGIGETNTELMRRHWRNEIRHVKKQLEKVLQNKIQQMDKRKRLGLPTVSIIGYTNAGKTSIFNLLTKKQNLVDNVLFATLDSTIGKLYLPNVQKETYVSDTIGFIQNLPPHLIESFRSTLMETINSDLLMHVIDISDPWYEDKIRAVGDILEDLGLAAKNQLYVFNKIDKAKNTDLQKIKDRYRQFHPLALSVKSGENLQELTTAIQNSLF